MRAEITEANELDEPIDLIVLMKLLRPSLPTTKFRAASLRSASIAVDAEVQAKGYKKNECLGAVVFSTTEPGHVWAWINSNGRVYREQPGEWRELIELQENQKLRHP